MDQPVHLKSDHQRRANFVAILVSVIVFPFAVYGLISGQYWLLVFTIVFPALFYGTFWTIGKTTHKRLEEKWDEVPFIETEKLPSRVEISGIVLKDMWQAPGTVVYQDGELEFKPIIGKATKIALSEIKDFTLSSWFNGKMWPGKIGIMLKVPEYWRLGFTVTEIEPWRSLLTHAVEQNNTVEE